MGAEKGRPVGSFFMATRQCLSPIVKQLERHVRSLLEPFILPRLRQDQFKFLTGRSTEDALLYADHILRTLMSNGPGRKGSVSAVSFDIQKAFDVVPKGKLVECLRSDYEIPTYLISWLMSYFYDREQRVKVNGQHSSWRTVKAGVLQGSVIGPLLFIAYFNSVTAGLSDEANLVRFADDLLLLSPLKNGIDEQTLQNETNVLIQSMTDKGLSLSAGKCERVVISESSVPSAIENHLHIGPTKIREVGNVQYLGVILDPKLR